MKILLFGKDGQVGWELQRSLAPLGEVVALGSRESELASDFLQPHRLAETVRLVGPDVIVNAAAYTAVDKAEDDQHSARLVNATSPGVLAEAADARGALLVHYSTDYVFDGSGSRPWTEDDLTSPLSVYGQTKLEGERLVQQHCRRHLIMRTSWVYGSRGGNFAKTMLRLAKERERLTVVNDQFGAPTGAELLADVSAHALRTVLGDSRTAGVYHVAAAGETTWHGYAAFVIARAAGAGQPLKASVEQVGAVPSSAFPTRARRPHNSRLATDRFASTFNLRMPPWEQGVARMLQEIF